MKSKPLILITLGILFAISPLINNNFNFHWEVSDLSSHNRDEMNSENVDLKVSVTSGGIIINGNSEWADFKNAGNCTGQGTYSDPYIIEDLEINGESINIHNSDVYFMIQDCTLFNTGVGINLGNVVNAKLINNTIFDSQEGIGLTNCNNNTILGNFVNNNFLRGIKLENSSNNTISGNTAINHNAMGDHDGWGIELHYDSDNNIISGNNASYNGVGILLGYCKQNTLTGNVMNECGLQVWGFWANLGDLVSNNIDTTNLVNGKPLYYYTNEMNLGSNNFTNAGQVYLINCTNSLISNLNTSYCSSGITFYYCSNNNVSGSTANNNEYGISLLNCDGNNISGNIANENSWSGIKLERSDNNDISGNTANNNIDQYGSFGFGIQLEQSDSNTVSGNTVNNNFMGILLESSNNNDITGNTANSNEHGIHLWMSGSNHILTNTISNNIVGIYTYKNFGSIISNEISNNIFSGNSVNIQEETGENTLLRYINGVSIILLGCAITLSIVLILWKMKYKRVI